MTSITSNLPKPLRRPYVLVYRDGPYAVAVDEKGERIVRSTDHADVIQEVVDYVYERGGGKIILESGIYDISKPIELRPGIEIVGECIPTLYDASPPDGLRPSNPYVKGTILKGMEDIDIFTGYKLYGVKIENIAIQTCRRALNIDAPTGETGIAFSVLRNIFVHYNTEYAFYIKNFQHIYVKNINVWSGEGGFMALINDNPSTDYGNSLFNKLYAQTSMSYPGLLVQSVEGNMSYCVFVHLQLNHYAGTGTEPSIKLVGSTKPTWVNRFFFFGLIIEEGNGDAAIVLDVNAQGNIFFVQHFHDRGSGAKLIKINDNSAVGNLFIGFVPPDSIKLGANASSWVYDHIIVFSNYPAGKASQPTPYISTRDAVMAIPLAKSIVAYRIKKLSDCSQLPTSGDYDGEIVACYDSTAGAWKLKMWDAVSSSWVDV